MNHTTATAHRRHDGAWLVACWCGKHSGWHALLSTCVARQTDHINQEREAESRCDTDGYAVLSGRLGSSAAPDVGAPEAAGSAPLIPAKDGASPMRKPTLAVALPSGGAR